MVARLGLWLALLTAVSIVSAKADETVPSQILVCEDELEVPPLTYRMRDGTAQPTERVTGYSVAIIQEIAADLGIETRFTLMPWARCQAEVEAGRQHLALNATWNADRAKRYLFSQAYFSAHDHYYFSKSRFPNGLRLTKLEELREYSLCGLNGFNYAHLQNVARRIDYEARDHRQVMLKLAFGHCDLFVEKQEIMAGFELIGKSWLQHAEISNGPLPETPPTRFHMLIQPTATGARLKEVIDELLDKMQIDGRLETLRRRHIDTGS
ncbi:substrate-binding periplasmic protein [Lacibacterium aquatile]|uniref:Substrate-binding periplasmic protein n=1 Tax=Lacibacterium aquatile TaxID=1168082 RepID=A0ABW5DW07_9PROT